MAKVFIEGRRDGYSPEQCGRTMTVGELIAYLENFDEDAKIYVKYSDDPIDFRTRKRPEHSI